MLERPDLVPDWQDAPASQSLTVTIWTSWGSARSDGPARERGDWHQDIPLSSREDQMTSTLKE